MFRPRHAYRSPITNRYRGKAKGCPVFNNLIEINSNMVEQHDECLECLAKLKNRTDLYKTLSGNNKPNNNVIKSLQRLSASASNNRLKTCLQFLIIKVNEKSITPKQTRTTSNVQHAINTQAATIINDDDSPRSIQNIKEGTFDLLNQEHIDTPLTQTTMGRHSVRRNKSHSQQKRLQLQKQHQLASPPQDQVSSTQDQVGPSQDDHDCQTSPMMAIHIGDEPNNQPICGSLTGGDSPLTEKSEGQSSPNSKATATQSSPLVNCHTVTASATTTSSTKSGSSPYDYTDNHVDSGSMATGPFGETRDDQVGYTTTTTTKSTTTTTSTSFFHRISASKKRRTHHKDKINVGSNNNSYCSNSDHENSSIASWSSASYSGPSPSSPMSSASSTSSTSSSCSTSSSSRSSSSSIPPSPSSSPMSSPDIINELKRPRLKLNEEKIRKIRKRPVLFDDIFYTSAQPSLACTPPTSSAYSPGQNSNATQCSDQSSGSRSLGLALSDMVIHTFQAPPKFVNNLKPCNLPSKSQTPSPASTPPVTTKVEMLNCAICGIKDKPPNINKIYGQNSCLLCTRFFAAFLKRPQQLYCAQDGDCLMTFDSRCQACWIKICLQKFDIEEDHRKIGQKYSPKLLSAPNVSLITIDTSVTR